MGNIMIASPLLSDEASVAGVGSEVTSMPAANLFNIQPTVKWRATDLSSIWAEFDLGAGNEPAGGAGVMVAKYYNGSTWAALTLTTDETALSGNTLAQNGKLTFTAPSNWALRGHASLDADMYYIRLEATAGTLSNTPNASLIAPPYIKNANIETYNGSTFTDVTKQALSEDGSLTGQFWTNTTTGKYVYVGATETFEEVFIRISRNIELLFLGSTNASSEATLRLRGADVDTDLTSSPDYDSGVNRHWPTHSLSRWDATHAFHFLTAPAGHRYWRIDIVDANNADTYYEAGRMYLSEVWQPSANINFGWGMRWTDPSTKEASRGGQLYITPGVPYRDLRFTLSLLSQAEMYEEAFVLDRLRGTHGDILAIIDPNDTLRLMDWSIYGVLEGRTPISNVVLALYEKVFRLRELV